MVAVIYDSAYITIYAICPCGFALSIVWNCVKDASVNSTASEADFWDKLAIEDLRAHVRDAAGKNQGRA